MMQSRRGWMVAITGLCTVAAAAYLIVAVRTARATGRLASGLVVDDSRLGELLHRPHVLFRSTRVGDGYGRIVAAAPGEVGVRIQSGLECDRIDAVPGAGICLAADRGVITRYWAVIVDASLAPRRRVELAGIPSRVRLSPDGRLAGITVFVSGHAYSNAQFSTRTTLLDVATGSTMADLEEFAMTRDRQPFKEADFNFWGITFSADSNLFYATLGSGGVQYLIKADAARRSGETIAEGIECPSLSPDNRRIAYKKRVYDGGRMIWRLAVLELATMTSQMIPGETRSVDDQVAWLDDQHVVYALADDTPGRGGTSIWQVDVDRGAASTWADGAYSPAILAAPASGGAPDTGSEAGTGGAS
jgi:hypothetical protein